MTSDWTDAEIQAIITDYFDMLAQELRGEPYNKAAHRRALMPKLSGRSDGSIERKHQNISAVLQEQGRPFIQGYKPLGNYQDKRRESVLAQLENRPGEFDHGHENVQEAFSWKVYGDNVAEKDMDRSAFIHNGTGIPKTITSFFDMDGRQANREVTLQLNGRDYQGVLRVDPQGRVRCMWRSDLAEAIRRDLPDLFSVHEKGVDVVGNAMMRFEKKWPGKYSSRFLSPTSSRSPRRRSQRIWTYPRLTARAA